MLPVHNRSTNRVRVPLRKQLRHAALTGTPRCLDQMTPPAFRSPARRSSATSGTPTNQRPPGARYSRPRHQTSDGSESGPQSHSREVAATRSTQGPEPECIAKPTPHSQLGKSNRSPASSSKRRSGHISDASRVRGKRLSRSGARGPRMRRQRRLRLLLQYTHKRDSDRTTA